MLYLLFRDLAGFNIKNSVPDDCAVNKSSRLYVNLGSYSNNKAEGEYGWEGNQTVLGNVKVEFGEDSAEVILEPRNQDSEIITKHLDENPSYHTFEYESQYGSRTSTSLSLVSKNPEIPKTDQELRAYVDITIRHQDRDSEWAF